MVIGSTIILSLTLVMVESIKGGQPEDPCFLSCFNFSAVFRLWVIKTPIFSTPKGAQPPKSPLMWVETLESITI